MVRLERAAGAAILVTALLAPALGAQTPGQTPRLVWLNAQAILAATPGRSDAESTFNREMVGFQAEIQRLQQVLDSAVQDYQRASVVMTPAVRQQREQALRDMEQRTRQRAQELQQQAQRREAELTSPIMQRVNAVIAGVRAEFNYAFVFDVSAEGNPIVQADPALDITQLVIQRLQAAGPAANPPPAAAPDSTRPPAQSAPTPPRPRP
jgi:outer membrane protein